jgi:PPM family protein phosphatase
LSGVRRVAVPRPAPHPDGRGSTVVPDRDEAHLDGMVLMTDRGLEHDRNEDAAAAGTVAAAEGQPPHAIVAAVCDGVSTSPDAYKASRAASTAGVEAMLRALAASRDMSSVVLAGLDDAAKAAAAAKTPGTDDRAPACTYAAAAVVFTSAGEAQITVANVGDSRAYWLPEPPTPPQRLTVDDSLAQGLISAGVPPDAHVVQKGAHTLTRWLGGNAKSEPWDESRVSTVTTPDRGVLLLCSDGLHNYLSEAADVAPFCNGTDPTAAARALVDHALRSGGHDNITVVLIPIAGVGR